MMSTDNCKRLFLWSGPRNISTTLMYSFAQRNDTIVFDEPLYGAYLSATKAKEYHPDAELIMKSMECDGQKVIKSMCGQQSSEVAFFKNMTHHLLDLDKSFMKNGLNIILTRNPKEMLPSFDKVIPNPSLADVGYADHTELVEYFEKESIEYVILDSTKILKNPKGVLQQLCDAADIEFQDEMLCWEKGPRKEDGIWASHWYSSVHSSTGYIPYVEKETPFPARLKTLFEECQKHYNALNQKALS